jgi:hypothetical protein
LGAQPLCQSSNRDDLHPAYALRREPGALVAGQGQHWGHRRGQRSFHRAGTSTQRVELSLHGQMPARMLPEGFSVDANPPGPVLGIDQEDPAWPNDDVVEIAAREARPQQPVVQDVPPGGEALQRGCDTALTLGSQGPSASLIVQRVGLRTSLDGTG